MTNLVEILKNAPEGLKLYSLVAGNVVLDRVSGKEDGDLPIGVENPSELDSYTCYDKYGKYFEDCGECVLFPSATDRSWDNWQRHLICLGDAVVGNDDIIGFAVNMDDDYIHIKSPLYDSTQLYHYKDVQWASSEQIEAVQKAAWLNHNAGIMEIEQTAKKIEPKEDIWTKEDFKPFDKVLVRDEDIHIWTPDFFSYIDEEFYICIGNGWKQCIPYNEETAHLVGTTDVCSEKYKTW